MDTVYSVVKLFLDTSGDFYTSFLKKTATVTIGGKVYQGGALVTYDKKAQYSHVWYPNELITDGVLPSLPKTLFAIVKGDEISEFVFDTEADAQKKMKTLN